MQRYGTVGRWSRFVFGSWAGLWTFELVRIAILGTKMNQFEADWLMPFAFIASPLYIVVATIGFPFWYRLRVSELSLTPRTAWWSPLFVGLGLIGPALWLGFGLEPIATLAAVNILSMPAAEICVQIIRRSRPPEALRIPDSL